MISRGDRPARRTEECARDEGFGITFERGARRLNLGRYHFHVPLLICRSPSRNRAEIMLRLESLAINPPDLRGRWRQSRYVDDCASLYTRLFNIARDSVCCLLPFERVYKLNHRDHRNVAARHQQASKYPPTR